MKHTQKPALFSDVGFILSLIGAAVGLGNIWRFPNILAKNDGGSAFIIIYFLALILIALPVALLEINYGIFFRRGVVHTFGKTVPKVGSFLGWKQIFVISFITFYYLTVLTWVGVSAFSSLLPNFFDSWGTDSNWFDTNILATKSGSQTVDPKFSWPIFGGGIFFILIVFIILSLGIKSGLEKANLIMVPILFFGLIGLTIYAANLKNADAGIRRIFNFNANNFKNLSIWTEAVKQVIFSTGIFMGILIVFSNSADRRMDKGNEAVIVIFADTLVGFTAGVLVMSIVANHAGNLVEGEVTLGKLSAQPTINAFNALTGSNPQTVVKESIVISDQMVDTKIKSLIEENQAAGPTLLFSFLPIFFFQFEQTSFEGSGQMLMFVFFLTVLFAAITSMIALTEVSISAFINNFAIINRRRALFFWALFALGFLPLFSFSFGGQLVDAQDAILLWLIIFLGIFETALMPFYKHYSEAIQQNDQHTFLKLGKFNWLKYLLICFVAPLLIAFFVINTFEIFGPMFGMTKNSNLNLTEYKGWTLVHTISYAMLSLVFVGTIFCSYWQYRQERQTLAK